ncbi:hypothetical protein IF1G_09691 [Cordyceps javanica]|uniref:Uncharacterized protein n=1 Tax=Cordyceps javanica TaxID=43265 RepID=A0A545UQ86_9HYPO|nr:hypothetical protein IF1G_09691 [Cordyceps javanica]TQW03591.1 hypothetical protein IF2G_08889 [Cordyceps javanica]
MKNHVYDDLPKVSQVMPTARGFVRGIAGSNKFTSTFIIEDVQYHFSGNFNPAVQEFSCNGAILTYDNVGQLTTQRPFSGKVGTEEITLTVNNGPRIEGPLDLPLSPASNVSGHGTWTQN